MKDDGEFAEDEGVRVHRVASLVVFVGWVVAAAVMQNDTRWIKMAMYLMMPVAWIWWPVSFRVVDGKGSGRGIGHLLPEYPRVVRGLAWLLLMVIPLLLFNSRKWKRDRREGDEALRGIEHLQGRP